MLVVVSDTVTASVPFVTASVTLELVTDTVDTLAVDVGTVGDRVTLTVNSRIGA